MAIYEIHKNSLWFPEKEHWGTESDIVAIGGDLSPQRILAAYSMGIFPWNEPEADLLWWHPLERAILKPKQVKISKSSRNLLNRHEFRITFNQAFDQVMEACKSIPRRGQDGTWITPEHQKSFSQLHQQGYAHSVEAWKGENLVGGLYGLALGSVFFGESMFSKESNAGKISFIHLAKRLDLYQFKMIDCQVYNDYLGSLGAISISREAFCQELDLALKIPQNHFEVFI